MPYDITSPGNERVKWLVRLRERRHRDEAGVFVVEGERLYHRALAAGLEPVITFVSDDRLETTGVIQTVEPSVLDKASYRSRSSGLISVFPQLSTRLDELELPLAPLILIAENIEKPGNLGAMLRTASAAGVAAVVAVGGTVDPHNPNVLRASTGALFSVPLAVSGWAETASWLTRNEVAILAAGPDAPHSVWETDLTGPIAVVIGAEADGLSIEATGHAHHRVSIPQATGGVDSLNASVAAGIVLFEAARQRRSRR